MNCVGSLLAVMECVCSACVNPKLVGHGDSVGVLVGVGVELNDATCVDDGDAV